MAKKAWLKNGKAIMRDGKVVLCDECPCGCECRCDLCVTRTRPAWIKVKVRSSDTSDYQFRIMDGKEYVLYLQGHGPCLFYLWYGAVLGEVTIDDVPTDVSHAAQIYMTDAVSLSGGGMDIQMVASVGAEYINQPYVTSPSVRYDYTPISCADFLLGTTLGPGIYISDVWFDIIQVGPAQSDLCCPDCGGCRQKWFYEPEIACDGFELTFDHEMLPYILIDNCDYTASVSAHLRELSPPPGYGGILLYPVMNMRRVPGGFHILLSMRNGTQWYSPMVVIYETTVATGDDGCLPKDDIVLPLVWRSPYGAIGDRFHCDGAITLKFSSVINL